LTSFRQERHENIAHNAMIVLRIEVFDGAVLPLCFHMA
jgi:hypothetical protein